MFGNVIVGVDGRDGGRDAIALAKALSTGRVTLVRACAADGILSRHAAGGFDEVLHTLAAAAREAGLDAELVPVADAPPPRALHSRAEAAAADLIVIGSARHGPVGRLLLGDVGRGVLHGARCPVAVAPKRFRGGPPRSVAVGTDGSPEGRAAVAVAAGYASATGADLTVCVAWESDSPPLVLAYPVDLEEFEARRRDVGRRILDATLATLPSSTAGQLLHGRPDLELMAAAREHDLLVVGSHGSGALRRIAVGSTSDRLVHLAPCPVIVVPRPLASRPA